MDLNTCWLYSERKMIGYVQGKRKIFRNNGMYVVKYDLQNFT